LRGDLADSLMAVIRRARGWAATRIPELLLVALALLLRLSLAEWYDVTLGYDYPTHHQYVRYLAENGRLPPYDLNVATYHPPLFYVLAAILEHEGVTPQGVGRLSIVCSCIQILLVWLGLELYLRGSRLARVLALAIAAVVPASVHVAGMVSNEALSDMLCTGALVLMPRALSRRGRSALAYGAACGGCLGLALLTKVSGIMVLTAFLVGVGVTMARSRVPDLIRERLKVTAAVLVVAGAIAGWHYVRHRVLYGNFVMTGYDQWSNDPSFKTPYLDRRTLGFVSYWDSDVFDKPFWASASQPRPRFWPMLVTTTFSDYYNFAFVPRTAGVPAIRINQKPMRADAALPARAAVYGGTVLAALAFLAWMVATRTLWRLRDHGRLAVLLVAPLAALGQLHFAIRFPYDTFGPIKGAYLQFAAPVYCTLCGVAIAALWKRRQIIPRLLALAGVAAIALVAVYTVYARIAVPLAWV
jgi:4-amino-4-deoxy-L-arabinose transferase-like glycosyltransferase